MGVLMNLVAQLTIRAAQLETEADAIEANGEVQGSNREAKTLRTIAQEFDRLAVALDPVRERNEADH